MVDSLEERCRNAVSMAQVKSLPSQSQEDFDKSYEVEEVHVLRDSRIVITTCATASKLKSVRWA